MKKQTTFKTFYVYTNNKGVEIISETWVPHDRKVHAKTLAGATKQINQDEKI